MRKKGCWKPRSGKLRWLMRKSCGPPGMRTVVVSPRGSVWMVSSILGDSISRAAGFMDVVLPSRSHWMTPIGEASISRLRKVYCSSSLRCSLRRRPSRSLNVRTMMSVSCCPEGARRVVRSSSRTSSMPPIRVSYGRMVLR